jgi:hypothetical protein
MGQILSKIRAVAGQKRQKNAWRAIFFIQNERI